MSVNLSEISRDLVTAQIKATIDTSLLQIRTLRADAYVETTPPKSYFIYAPAAGYQTPAVFTIVDRISFREYQNGANFVTAVVNMSIFVLIEDRDLNHLVVKAERYQTALHQSLNQKTLVSHDNSLKIFIKIVDASFSDIYAPKENTPSGMFRKEVHLTLEVQHYEQL